MSIEALNESCHCISVDEEALKAELERDHTDLYAQILKDQPHLFSSVPVFVSPEHLAQMRRAISAIEEVIATKEWQAAALEEAPAIARHDPKVPGVFFGFDFHMSDRGPRLIEINTNAGGAFLNVALAKAQKACCDEVRALVQPASGEEDTLADMFVQAWRTARGNVAPPRVAIVDAAPEQQYLYPEFLLAAAVLRARSMPCTISDPKALELRDGALWAGSERIDLVYNRTTDFYFADEASRVLKEAYLSGAAVVTPHPRAHALYANKANLVRLSDPGWLARLPVSDETKRAVLEAVPRTVRVFAADRDALWSKRKELFFKPEHGFGSKAAYRGDKLTKATFEEILQGAYVAQALVPPSTRTIKFAGEERPLKLDVRAYVYRGEVQLFAARLYQGQTTNFRTQGGGFAPVYTRP
ncbi:MAG: hypothetical protein IT381_24380 [Deltaproteobacteria bacterium]|nr:hypothetical protein [Deltaproteobacteria bacterium]